MPKPPRMLVCDSSSLISLTDSCFVHVFYFIKRKLKGGFLIPPSVEYEAVEHPRSVKSYALHAIRLRRAIDDGAIEVAKAPIERLAREIRWLSNNLFFAGGTPLHLLQEGEAEVLALANELDLKNILIDERTTRLLAESPYLLCGHLEEELAQKISVNEENLSAFLRLTRNMHFFRSSELLLLAYEHGYFDDYGALKEEALEASLYRLKYNGCSVGFGEISDYLELHMGKRG
ncbi:MAG: hypothetical protein N3G22_04735 [Candidatus Micrarchaeota archaeon]|nr:hypothetical protein [Candidatus Micrarchaeota archaeon]